MLTAQCFDGGVFIFRRYIQDPNVSYKNRVSNRDLHVINMSVLDSSDRQYRVHKMSLVVHPQTADHQGSISNTLTAEVL